MDNRVLRLLALGTDPNLWDLYGSTPLSLAIRHGTIRTVRNLLNHDADPNMDDLSEQSPLMFAFRERHDEMVNAILDAGGRPHTDSRFDRDSECYKSCERLVEERQTRLGTILRAQVPRLGAESPASLLAGFPEISRAIVVMALPFKTKLDPALP